MSALVELFKQVVRIDNPSGGEEKIRAFIAERLTALGLTDQHVDDAGNLFVRVPGKPAPGESLENTPVILLSAHMDSVPPCHGIEPTEDVKDGRPIVRSAGNTILGADDKSGIATILSVAAHCAQHRFEANHPLELLFSTREEVGLLGARAFDLTQLRASYAYVLDGEGQLGEIFHAGASQENLQIHCQGKPSHAGIAPDEGISAIEMAAAICVALPNGRVSRQTTTNLGLIQGGEAMNVVASKLTLKGEARSQSEEELKDLLETYRKTCQAIEARYPGSRIELATVRRYDAFVVPQDAPVVTRAVTVCRQMGVTPQVVPMSIGSDAHVLNHGGVPTVVLGMGFHYSHSLGEFIYCDEFERVFEMTCRLISNAAPGAA